MPKQIKSEDGLPSAAYVRRMVLAIQNAGLTIKQVDVGPNRIRILTDLSDQSVEEELTPFDIWKMGPEASSNEKTA